MRGSQIEDRKISWEENKMTQEKGKATVQPSVQFAVLVAQHTYT